MKGGIFQRRQGSGLGVKGVAEIHVPFWFLAFSLFQAALTTIMPSCFPCMGAFATTPSKVSLFSDASVPGPIGQSLVGNFPVVLYVIGAEDLSRDDCIKKRRPSFTP